MDSCAYENVSGRTVCNHSVRCDRHLTAPSITAFSQNSNTQAALGDDTVALIAQHPALTVVAYCGTGLERPTRSRPGVRTRQAFSAAAALATPIQLSQKCVRASRTIPDLISPPAGMA